MYLAYIKVYFFFVGGGEIYLFVKLKTCWIQYILMYICGTIMMNWHFKLLLVTQSMSQIRLSTRLEALKAPRWRIWVPDLKDIYPWQNFWRSPLKNLWLPARLKLKSWTWSVAKNIDAPKNTWCMPKKSSTLWENYAIADKKKYKYNF